MTECRANGELPERPVFGGRIGLVRISKQRVRASVGTGASPEIVNQVYAVGCGEFRNVHDLEIETAIV